MCHNTILQTRIRYATRWSSISWFASIMSGNTIVKNNKDIKNIKILGNTFLYISYADGTTFFLKKFGSIKELKVWSQTYQNATKPGKDCWKWWKWQSAESNLIKKDAICNKNAICKRCNKNIRNIYIYFHMIKMLN